MNHKNILKTHRRTLYCSGYWTLPDYRKNSLQHYRARIPRTFRMLAGGNPLFWYESDDVLEMVKESAQVYGINLIPRRLAFADLPAQVAADAMTGDCSRMGLKERPNVPMEQVRERGVANYWREYVDAGPEVYRSLVLIWLSKVLLLSDTAKSEISNDFERFSWVDVSITRMNGQPGWDFRKQKQPIDCISHYGNRMTKNDTPLPLSAGYLSGGGRSLGRAENLL